MTDNAAWERMKAPMPDRHAYVTIDGVTEYGYLSTSCLHDSHGYCKSDEGYNDRDESWRKTSAQCKFCADPCHCPCHAENGGVEPHT